KTATRRIYTTKRVASPVRTAAPRSADKDLFFLGLIKKSRSLKIATFFIQIIFNFFVFDFWAPLLQILSNRTARNRLHLQTNPAVLFYRLTHSYKLLTFQNA